MVSPSIPARLTLVITSLETGGAERVLSELANHWASQGREITFITLTGTAGDFYPLDPRVHRLALDVLSPSRGWADALVGNVRRLVRLRRAIRSSAPHLVVAFTDQTNVLSLLATRGLGIPVVVSERNDPHYQPLPPAWDRARRWAYRRAQMVVVQTEEVRLWASRFLPPERVTTIPNAVAELDSGAQPTAGPVLDLPARYIVGMGSLSPRKGFDMLLRAFAAVAGDPPDLHLVILGEGPERSALVALSRSLGLSHRVHLPGTIRNHRPILERADLFVLSSRFEGFPNALLEAMSCGCAVVSFDCPSGPRNIIRSGYDGLLVPAADEDALAGAMRRLLHDDAERNRLGDAARQVTVRFSRNRVLGAWDAAVQSAWAGRGVRQVRA